MRILITGGAGFVGSNLALKIKNKYPDYKVVILDNLKRRGSELNLQRLRNANIEFVHGDIRIPTDFDEINGIDLLIEAAAEPSVLAGINGGTEYLIDTNLNGSVNCLNFAKKHGAKFIFLSTSRVYPIETLEAANYIEEDTRFSWSDQQSIQGISNEGVSERLSTEGYRSLYGSTKLASELIAQEYHHILGLDMVINRCGVITGPYQMGKIDQGVVVLWAARHFWQGKLSYIGYGGLGKQVRDMLHVDDLWRLIDFQMHHFDQVNGKTLNVGGGKSCSSSLLELTALCEKYSQRSIEISRITENRPADLRIYLTDNNAVSKLTGWTPKYRPDEILSEIFEWLKEDQKILKSILA